MGGAMRYPQGSIQLNQSRDLPLLRQILRSEFVTHSHCSSSRNFTTMSGVVIRSTGG